MNGVGARFDVTEMDAMRLIAKLVHPDVKAVTGSTLTRRAARYAQKLVTPDQAAV